jgi:hypothetical protein
MLKANSEAIFKALKRVTHLFCRTPANPTSAAVKGASEKRANRPMSKTVEAASQL